MFLRRVLQMMSVSMRESCTSNHFGLVQRKGVYPYDYMDSFDRFNETKLPSQDAFFRKLSGHPCSDLECTHATRVWTAFGCRAMAEYDDIYLQTIFEKFCLFVCLFVCLFLSMMYLRNSNRQHVVCLRDPVLDHFCSWYT